MVRSLLQSLGQVSAFEQDRKCSHFWLLPAKVANLAFRSAGRRQFMQIIANKRFMQSYLNQIALEVLYDMEFW